MALWLFMASKTVLSPTSHSAFPCQPIVAELKARLESILILDKCVVYLSGISAFISAMAISVSAVINKMPCRFTVTGSVRLITKVAGRG